jgi:gluconate 2-dehydrogenase gamma chain
MADVGDHWPRKKSHHPRAAKPPTHGGVTRRSLLATAALLISTSRATARVVTRVLPWRPSEAYPVTPALPRGYLFFTASEAAIVDAGALSSGPPSMARWKPSRAAACKFWFTCALPACSSAL